MNTIKKVIINTICFAVCVILTFYLIFKNNDINEILKVVKQVDLKYILIAICCMFCFILSEAINIRRTLILVNCKIKFIQSLKYAIVGFFFSSVTPGSSGGDPMQIYYMKKDKLSLGNSALAIFTEFSSFQFVTITMAVIGFITNYEFIQQSIGNIKFLLIIGLSVNIIILMVLLLTVFSNKIIIKLVDIICKILQKIHYKKVEQFREKSIIQINEYKKGAKILLTNKRTLVKILLTTLIQIILFHSIPYFIYLSFGIGGANILRFIAVQAVLYISVSSIPFPGAVGISEGGFLIIYKLLFPAELLSSAMLLSRGISFYLFVTLSGIAILLFKIQEYISKKNVKVL